MKTVPEFFGSCVFDDSTMRARLPKETYKAMLRTNPEETKEIMRQV